MSEYGENIGVGCRVELHPGLDLWMRGARFGVVKSIKGNKAKVEMDHPQITKLVTITLDRLKRI